MMRSRISANLQKNLLHVVYFLPAEGKISTLIYWVEYKHGDWIIKKNGTYLSCVI
jgi:hypothetical protein